MNKPIDKGIAASQPFWPDIHPPTPVNVSVDVKVIPGGIKMKDGRRKLQFSLVFSPKAPDPSNAFPLSEWPSTIERLCGSGIDVLVSCLPETFSAVEQRPRPDGARAVRLRVTPVQPDRRESAIGEIDACWKTVIGIGHPAHTKTPWEALAFNYDAQRQADLQTATMPGDIVGVPRADMAILLQSWRARVVLSRVSGSFVDTEPGCDYLGVLKDWVMNREELRDMAFGDLGPKSDDEASSGQTQAQRNRIVAEINERRTIEQTAVQQVRGKMVEGAVRIQTSRERYLNASGSAGALRMHGEHCSPQSFCDSPFDISADVMSGDSRTIHDLYGAYRRLSEAQLSFDDSLKGHYEPTTDLGKLTTQPQWAPPKPKLPDVVDPELWEPLAAVKRKLFALQAMPSLARVFRFVVDAEADLGDLPSSPDDLQAAPADTTAMDMMAALSRLRPLKVLEADSVDVDAFGDVAKLVSTDVTQPVTNYLFLSAAIGPDAPWTTAKLRYPTGDALKLAAVSGHFLPCSLEEMDLAAVVASPACQSVLGDNQGCQRASLDADGNMRKRYILPAMRDGLLLQFDGVLDLGAGRRAAEPRDRRPRYDMLSLDVVAAMESQANLVRSHQGRLDPSDEGVHARPTYRSAGLMLLDRWRAAAMASARADAKERSKKRQEKEPVVFDSSALTVGYRIDVGIRRKWQPGRLHNWRTLGNRIIRYAYPPQPDLIEQELARLGLPLRSEARVRMDSTPVLPGASADATARYPEEILVCWEGDPLGVQVVEGQGGASTTVQVDPAQDLAISRFYELPDDGEPAYLIPKLTFGKRYRYGLRADYLGGVTAPLERARAIYEEASGGMLALPEASIPPGGKWTPATPDSPRAKGRRFLRQERLLSPEVAVPQHEVDAARKSGDRKRLRDQSALEAVVRTAKRRGTTPSTLLDTDSVTRILIPPGVSQDFAEWHGVLRQPEVFAGRRSGSGRGQVVIAADGLKNVAYDAEKGGLRRRTALNHASQLASVSDQVVRKDAPDPNDRDGDPVFVVDPVAEVTPSKSGARAQRHLRRVLPFFPDPAAHSMVLALRKPGFAGGRRPAPTADPEHRDIRDYVKGAPAVLDLTHSSLRYPDTLVVALEVKRTGNQPRKIETLSHEAAIPAQYRTIGTIGANGFNPARIDRSTIGAGLVPATRARIELAVGEEFELDTWCVPSVAQLDAWFDVVETSAVLAIIKQCLGAAGKTQAASLACSEGFASILGSTEGTQVDRLLKDYGAIDDDDAECGLGGLTAPGSGMRMEIAQRLHAYLLQRPIPEIAAVQTMRIAHAVGEPNYTPAFKPAASDTGTETLRLTGLDVIRLNPEKLGAAAPGGATAAETAEAQEAALRQFVAGNRVETWHPRGKSGHHVDATGLLVGGSIGVDLDTCESATIYARIPHPHTEMFDDVRIGKRSTRVEGSPRYGFTVAKDHRVSLDREEVVLVRLEGLKPSADTSARLDGLEAVDLLFNGPDVRKARRGYQPTDYKARRMELSVEATSRFGSDFDWAAGQGAKASNPGNALFDPEAGWTTSAITKLLSDGNPCHIWIPSTRRPDPIDPTSILPAFVWHEEGAQPGTTLLTRRTIVRLRFRRPWFSSGEGERLGIVLWPPDIFSHDPTTTDFPPPPDQMERDLYDRELRDGTGYITRCGADPIRQGGAPADGEFMPLESFRIDGNELVSKVPRVSMPIPLGADDAPSETTRRSLQVALLAFEPLFDPVDELWYVDLDISGRQMPDGWVRLGLVRYQPHAIDGQEVSEPTVVFTQILPRRRIRVDRLQSGPASTRLRVTIEGVGSLGAASDERLTGRSDKAFAQRPVFALTVTKTKTLNSAPVSRASVEKAEEIEIATDPKNERLEFRGTTDDGRGYLQAKHGDDGLTWTKEFEVKTVPHEGASYNLLLEEIDLRPPETPEPGGTTFAENFRFIASIKI